MIVPGFLTAPPWLSSTVSGKPSGPKNVHAVRPPSVPVFKIAVLSELSTAAVLKNSKSTCLLPLVTTSEAPA